MENYILGVNEHEKVIIQRYMKTNGFYIVSYCLGAFMTVVGVVLGPIIMPDPFPAHTMYPFAVDSHPVVDIIYILQSIAGFQCATLSTIDVQMTMLLWCCVIRLDNLGIEITKVTTKDEFHACIKKHQQILA